MGDHNFERLKAHILPLSNSKEFYAAKNEWKLVGVQIQEDWDNCPCGQEIKELCYIENIFNKNKTFVGNVCVNQFIGIETGNLFAGLKRISQDSTANANEDLIIHAFKLGYIFESEYQIFNANKTKKKAFRKATCMETKN